MLLARTCFLKSYMYSPIRIKIANQRKGSNRRADLDKKCDFTLQTSHDKRENNSKIIMANTTDWAKTLMKQTDFHTETTTIEIDW